MSRTNFRIGHLENLQSPWGNAAGLVKTPEEAHKMASQTGNGWQEHGSTTLEARIGNGPNGEKVYHHDPLTGKTTNSLGMPNPGADMVIPTIPAVNEIAARFEQEVVWNVAPVTNEPAEELRELVTRFFEGGARAVLVNLGCPNVLKEDGSPPEILCYNPKETELVLSGLTEVVQKYQKVFVRLSPAKNAKQAKQIYRPIIQSGNVSAVWIPNTWPLDPEAESPLEVGGGGESGPYFAKEAIEQLLWARESLINEEIDVVTSTGIMDSKALGISAAAQLREALAYGVAGGAGTTFYYESEDWEEDTYKLLEKLGKLMLA